MTWADSKHQLCWWHLRKAIRERMAKNKLSTTPYNAVHACSEFRFINSAFAPSVRADKDEDKAAEMTGPHPWAKGKPKDTPLAEEPAPPMPGPNSLPVKIAIPASFKANHPLLPKDASSTYETPTSNIFCPPDLRERVVDMVEHHLCMHPSIPGPSAPTPAGIQEWAVQQMYTFCQYHGLCSLWAYLWENWYRNGHWELWARAPCEKVPRLKTTMLCETQ